MYVDIACIMTQHTNIIDMLELNQPVKLPHKKRKGEWNIFKIFSLLGTFHRTFITFLWVSLGARNMTRTVR